MMRSSRFQRLTLWWFVLSLVLAQALGMAHRAVHLDLQIIGHEYAAASTHMASSNEHTHSEACASKSWFSALFASHEEGDDSCRLLDASLGSDALKSHLPVVFIAPGALFLVAFAQAELAALRAALAQARAPPI
jgi:hypothetical protein